MQAAAGAAARAGYTTRRVRQLADVHRLEGASAVGTRVSAVGAPGPLPVGVSHFIYIHLLHLYIDGGRCTRDGTARSGLLRLAPCWVKGGDNALSFVLSGRVPEAAAEKKTLQNPSNETEKKFGSESVPGA